MSGHGPSVQVVGAGLLGTSVGLALSATPWRVWLADVDQRAQEFAEDLGAGTAGWSEAAVDLVLLAVPPAEVGSAMKEAIRLSPEATVSDVASIKTEPQREAERLGISHRFVGGHPMAGRERSGAGAAQADLFDARPWAICPTGQSEAHRVDLVERLARDCGADPVVLDAATHDAAVALVSHLPHVAASAVARQLAGADPVTMGLAGQGLRDTVRVAGGDPGLWVQILGGNAAAVAPLVRRMSTELSELAGSLETMSGRQDDSSMNRQSAMTLEDFLAGGQAGHASIPGKHGLAPAEYAVVPVVIADEPGALARLFTTVAKAGASVEDISLEHAPGHPVGIIELSVQPSRADDLRAALHSDGWSHH